MKFRDAFAMGGRSLKERPLETGLIILGIALSACVASASLLLLGSQSAETERLLQGPAYREIIVQTETGNGPDSATALREISQGTQDRISFTDKDIENVLASTPSIRYSYKAASDNIRVNGFGGPGAMVAASASPSAGSAAGTGAVAAGGTGSAGTTTVISDGNATLVMRSGGDAAPNAAAASPGTSAQTGGAASQTASASPAASANPGADMGPPGDPFANQPQASLAAGESLLKPDVSEFRAMSVSPEFFLAYGIETAYGVLFTDTETQNNAATLVLGQGLAAQIFPEVKAADLVGKKVRLENRIWAIAGVLSAEASHIVLSNGTSLSDMAFTPAAETVIRNGDQVIRFNRGNSSLRFAVGNSTELSQAAVSLTAYFEKTYGVGKVRISVPFDEARLSRDGFDRLLWVIVAFGVGALVMALINLMNMMLTRALRRQAIMGIMGAMGASQRDLLNLQAIEGGLMATGGSLLGIALSLPFYGVLYNAGKNLFGIAGGQAPLDLGVLFVTAPAILILGLVLALIPAWQSSSMPITMALRSE